MDIINSPVLVLNQSYEPLDLCRTRRAIVLIIRGKAEVLENSRGELHSVNRAFQIPSVIRLVYMVKRPHHQKKLSRLEVFNRDEYTCQYCGRETKELTLDHVVPRRRDGMYAWDNIVSACIRCNRQKGGRTPDEAGMRLLHQPRPPRNDGFSIPYHLVNSHDEWQKYLPPLN